MKKYLSLFLAALILALSLPLNSIFSQAAISSEDQALIDKIKSAWAEMGIKVAETTPNNGWKNVTMQSFSSSITDILPENAKDLPDTIGSVYAKVTLSSISTEEPTESASSYGSGALMYGAFDNVDISKCDVYLSFFIESLNEGSMYLLPFFRSQGENGGLTGKRYNIESTDVGKWVTLSSSQLKGENYNLVNNLGNKLILSLNSTKINSIYLGSVIFTKPAALPDDTESWGLANWISAAKDLNLNEYVNTVHMREVLKSLPITDADKIKEIKSAWNLLQEEVFVSTPDSNHKNITVNAYPVSNVEGLPENAKINIPDTVGDVYAVSNIAKSTAISNPTTAGSNFIRYSHTNENVSGCNVYFSFYAQSVSGTVSFVPFYRGKTTPSGSGTGMMYTINPQDVGKWVTLSGSEITGSGFKDVTDLNNNIILCINSSSENNIIFGSFVFTRSVSLPDGSENWNIDRWISEAKSLDLTDYYNTEAFKNAISGISTEESVLIDNLRDAWRGVEERVLDVAPVSASDDVEISINSMDNKDNLPTGAANIPKLAGLSYGLAKIPEITKETTVDTGGSTYIKYGSSSMDISKTKVYFTFFVKELKGELSIITYFRKTGDDGSGTGKKYEIKTNDIGKWITLDIDDLTGSDFSLVDNIGNGIILWFNSTEANDIVIGDFVFYKNKSLPEDVGSWSLAKWVINAKALDTTNCLNTENLKTAIAEAEAYIEEHSIPYADILDVPDDLSVLGDNILAGITPTINYFNGYNKSLVTVESAKTLTDGDKTTALEIENLNGAKGSYIEISYLLGGFVSIKNIVAVLPENAKLGTYKIYTSQKHSELFDSKNCDIKILNEETETYEQLLAPYNKAEFTSIGFRFTVDDAKSFALTELGIYGEKSDVAVDTGNYSNNELKAIGTNLLSTASSPKIRVNGVNTQNTGNYNYKNLFDCYNDTGWANPVASWNDGPDHSVCDLFYDLGSTHKIDKFLLNSLDEIYLQVGLYEIYVANSVGELFLSSNKVITYDNGVNGDKPTTVTQLFQFAEGEEVIGRYVGFRILCGINNYESAKKSWPGLLYLRLTELGVYGEKYTLPAKPTNMLSHIPIDVYRVDALENSTKISNQELTPEKIKVLYDGNYNNSVSITTGGKRLDFVFNLCGEMQIDALNFYANSEQITQIEVYSGEDVQATYDKANLICSAESSVPFNNLEKTLEKPVKTRFLRYAVTVSGSTLEVKEIEAIGMDNQKLTYRNLLLENSNTIKIMSFNYKTKGFKNVQEQENKYYASIQQFIRNMTDGDAMTVYDVYAAKQGESSIDIVVDLGSLHSVDSLKLKAGSDENHWPSYMKVYIGSTEKDVIDADAEVDYEFKTKSSDGVYAYEFAPQYARYLRFQITESKNPYMNEHMLTVISELEVYGLSVSGVQAADANAVLSFTDPNTNIKVNILKLDDNDVYTEAKTLRVTPLNPSMADKNALKEHYIMIYGKKYLIELLDRDGKVLEDLGGRNVSVFLPVEDGLTLYTAYVAGGNNGNVSVAETFQETERVYANFESIKALQVMQVGFVTEFPEGYFTEIINKQEVISNSSQIVSTERTVVDTKSGIKVVYEKGVLPEDVTLIVKKLGKEILPNILAEQFDDSDFVAYKLTFISNGEIVVPKESVRIIFPTPEGMEISKCKIYSIPDDRKSMMDMKAIVDSGSLSIFTLGGNFMITDSKFDTTLNKEITTVKKGQNGTSSQDYTWIIIVAVIAVVVLAAVGIVIFIIRKRKTNN